MVRSRANTITKNKYLQADNKDILCNSFPIANDEPNDPYRNNKVRLNTRQYYKRVLLEDLDKLESNFKFKKSCGEPELLPYVEEAIEIVQKNLNEKKENNESEESYVSIQKQKEEKATIESLKSMINKESDYITENNQDFYYFYQSSTGENLFLHNVSYKMLHQ